LNIWIFNHHALTPDMSGGTRHYDFAKELVKRGHNVTIVASSFHYSKYKEMKHYGKRKHLHEVIDGINFIWIKTPSYFGNGIGRVNNMLAYAFHVIQILPKLNLKKPDVIVGSSVHLFAVWAAYKLAKKYKVSFVMEVRDLWPQTLIDMGISKWHPFVILLGKLEKFLYKKADKIISNLPFAYEYIEKIVPQKKVIWISNGTDVSSIKYIPREKNDKFIVTYTGAIGVANNLQILLDVAMRFRNKKNIYFKIIGEGPEKEKLIHFAQINKLTNVFLEGAVAKKKMSKILEQSDVLFFHLKDSPVFNYGISSNKLFDYMASGRVVLFSANTRNNPIKEAAVGYTIAPNNLDKLETTISEIYELSFEERKNIGKRLREHVEKNYSIPILVNKLENVLKEVLV